jgi:hypothetical protein
MTPESDLARKPPSSVFVVGYRPRRLSADEIRVLLTECVNLRDQSEDTMRHFKHCLEGKLKSEFADLFPEVTLHQETCKTLEDLKQAEPNASPHGSVNQELFDLLRNWLRRTWEDPNPERRKQRVSSLREYINALRKPLPERIHRLIPVMFFGEPRDPEEPTPLEQALLYLLNSVDKLRCCPNIECPARYFLAARRNHRYCSEHCAQMAEREQKREWWNTHRKKNRRGRRGRTAKTE